MASRRELTLVASDTLRSSPGGRLGCSRTDADAASLKDPARATDGSGAEDDPGGDVDDRRDRASVSSTERSASSRAASRVSLLSFDGGSEANLTFVSALERGFADAAAAAAARSLAW
jgi:hypothetical protein